MKIWTTDILAGAFSIDKKFSVEVRAAGGIQEAFLQNAVPGDMALIDLPEDYIGFLAAAKAKGIMGPFILISPEPTMIDEQLKRYRALILDIKKIELSEISEVINFIADRYCERDVSAFNSGHDATAATASGGAGDSSSQQEQIQDPERIGKVLDYIFRADVPVIISARIVEDGTPVTARGLCYIESFSGRGIILNRFSPRAFSEAAKESAQINLVLPYRSESYDAVSHVLKAAPGIWHVSVPEALFIEKRKSIRVEPGKKRPVALYIMRQNEPTTSCRVIDISLGGLCFETSGGLAKDGVYVFAIALPAEGIVLSYGKILYQHNVAPVCRYGVRLNIHPGDEERIAHYIMGREKEIAALLAK